MARIRILPYRQGSRSARALSEALEGRVLRLQGSRFIPRRDDVIINWGRVEEIPENISQRINHVQLLNNPYAVRQVSNKRTFFQRLEGLDITPRFWINQREIPEDAYPIVCRTVLAGHSGAGIVVANTPAELVDAPLYVQYVKKQDEFRIHVGRDGRIISEQRKARRLDVENPNWQIRNHANGFVFQREGIVVPEQVRTVAAQAFLRTSLDFGAVDVIYNSRQERAYVLEINSAPGLEGQTVSDYAEFFRTIIRG